MNKELNSRISLGQSAFKARFEPELTLLIQLTLYKFSLWDSGASYGAKLQGLRYIWKSSGDNTREGQFAFAMFRFAVNNTLSAFSLPRRLLLVHGALTLIIPYIHTRIRTRALSQAWPDAPSSDRRRKTWELLTRLESTHSLLALLNFIAFLCDGRYASLTMSIYTS